MQRRQRSQSLLRAIHDPLTRIDDLREMFECASGEFVLCLGGTQTSDHEGISAAGATPADRRLTPSIDGDILLLGRTRDREKVPVSPGGIVSPVVIVRACLGLLCWQPFVVDCGSFRSPLSPRMVVGTEPARCLSSGAAMPGKTAQDLFTRGLEQGKNISGKGFLLIGECVPGGTTTAAAFLQACGLDGASHASSSLHLSNKAQRLSLIRCGLEKAGLSSETIKRDPLAAISAIGDPMQPFAAGLALGACQRMPVILAGGSQMLAVFHLARLLAKAHDIEAHLSDVYVVTTKWVADDGASNTRLLSELVEAQYFASAPDFTRSIHAGLRAYEDGNVKEGLGAGALMAAAQAACNLDNDALVQAIDNAYNLVVLGKNLVEI